MNCEANGVEAIYFGQTPKTLTNRQAEHTRHFSKKPMKSHMRQHIRFFHNELLEEDSINSLWFKVISQHTSSFYRQLNEVIHISNFKNINLNSKEEYEHCYILRLNTVDFTQNRNEDTPALLRDLEDSQKA